jgi:hypothetical protein
VERAQRCTYLVVEPAEEVADDAVYDRTERAGGEGLIDVVAAPREVLDVERPHVTQQGAEESFPEVERVVLGEPEDQLREQQRRGQRSREIIEDLLRRDRVEQAADIAGGILNVLEGEQQRWGEHLFRSTELTDCQADQVEDLPLVGCDVLGGLHRQRLQVFVPPDAPGRDRVLEQAAWCAEARRSEGDPLDDRSRAVGEGVRIHSGPRL